MRLPNLSRRKLLALLSLTALAPSLGFSDAQAHLRSLTVSAKTPTTQVNLDTTLGILLNIFQTASNWKYVNTPTAAPNVPSIPVAELDPATGIPTSIVAGTNGVQASFTLYPTEIYSGIYVLDWIGQGTLVVPGNGVNTGFVPASGFSFANLLQANGSFQFTLQNDGTPTNLTITAITTKFTQFRLYRLGDQALLNAGQIVGADYLKKIQQAKPRTIRTLDLLGSINSNGTNDCNLATWEQRKPRTAYSYHAAWWTPGNYAGQATLSGNSYTVTGTAPLSDKLVQHVLIPAAPANSANGASLTCSVAASTGVVTVSNHGLASGDIVVFGNGTNGGAGVSAPFVAGTYYYALPIDANTFNLSATRGGSAITGTSAQSGVGLGFWTSLSIDGVNYYPLVYIYVPYPGNPFTGYGGPTAGSTITAVFDQSMSMFVMSDGINNVGQLIGYPPEVVTDMVVELGATAIHKVAPYLSMETAASVNSITDFMPSWMQDTKTRYPALHQYVEPPNETWNSAPAFFATFYTARVAAVRWNGLTADSENQVYGKWTSTLGQAASTVFGNDRTRYSVICAIQSVSAYGGGTGGNTNRFQSGAYVSLSGGSAACNWIDRGCCATYFGPAERFLVQELVDAFNWTVTNANNATVQSALAEAYAATCAAGNTQYTLAYNLQIFTNFKAYLQSLPTGSTVAGMVAYEGGYSPDYLTGNWSTTITGATQANPCVLTLAGTTSNSEKSGMAGNPAVVGMCVSPSNVGGMVGLNVSQSLSASFTANSPTITLSGVGAWSSTATYTSGTFVTSGGVSYQSLINSNLNNPPSSSPTAWQPLTNLFAAGQTICFSNANQNVNQPAGGMPAGVLQCQPYYVVNPSGNTIQVSLTKGGTAVTPTTAGGFQSTKMQQCFVVNGTNIGGNPNQISIDFDASAQPAYVSGGTLTYTFSQHLSNNMRWAAKSTNTLGAMNTNMNGLWYGLASSGFVMENVSHLSYTGTDNVWSVLDPNIYAPVTPQWASIMAANQ